MFSALISPKPHKTTPHKTIVHHIQSSPTYHPSNILSSIWTHLQVCIEFLPSSTDYLPNTVIFLKKYSMYKELDVANLLVCRLNYETANYMEIIKRVFCLGTQKKSLILLTMTSSS